MGFSMLPVMIIEAIVMLFILRSLMQSGSADYYHPVTQAVIKLTQPVLNLLPFRQKQYKGFYYASFLVALAIGVVGSLAFMLYIGAPLALGACFGVILTIKSLGYLIVFLLIAQALTSWLPSTRSISVYCYQLTYPIVFPVQKLIPPIGMIDISLMVVLIAIYALDHLISKLLFGISQILGYLWYLA